MRTGAGKGKTRGLVCIGIISDWITLGESVGCVDGDILLVSYDSYAWVGWWDGFSGGVSAVCSGADGGEAVAAGAGWVFGGVGYLSGVLSGDAAGGVFVCVVDGAG